MSEKPLTPWIIAKANGQIVTAHCDCVAGVGETCSHVASVLWALESGVRLRDSMNVTQKRAYWVVPHAIKDVPYAPVSNIEFTGKKKCRQMLFNHSHFPSSTSSSSPSPTLAPSPSPAPAPAPYPTLTASLMSTEQLITSQPCPITPPVSQLSSPTVCSAEGSSSTVETYLPCKKSLSDPTEEEVQQFFTALAHTSSKPAILSLVEPYCSQYIPESVDEGLPICLCDLQKPDYLQYGYSELVRLAEQCRIVVTPKQMQLVELKTRSQAKSPLWFQMHSGRVTASKFKSACHTDPALPSMSFVTSVCYPELTKFKNAATTWGCQHEKFAFMKYTDLHGSKCKDKVKV